MSDIEPSPLDVLVLAQDNKCHYCNCEMDRVVGSNNHATIEHLVDKWSSPKHQKIDTPNNLVVACWECNNTRGATRNKIARAFYKTKAIKANIKIAIASTPSAKLYKMFGPVPQHLFN